MKHTYVFTFIIAAASICAVLLFDKIGKTPVTFSQIQMNKNKTMDKYKEDWTSEIIKQDKQNPYNFKIGDTIAKITIPEIDIYELPVLLGSTPVNNNWHITSPGHEGNWSLFGESGVTCVGAHNYQLFKDLPKLMKGDKILIETASERFVYVVYKTDIYHHDKDNWDRVASYHKDNYALNLMTCYPIDAVKTNDMYIVYTSLQKGTIYLN